MSIACSSPSCIHCLGMYSPAQMALHDCLNMLMESFVQCHWDLLSSYNCTAFPLLRFPSISHYEEVVHCFLQTAAWLSKAGHILVSGGWARKTRNLRFMENNGGLLTNSKITVSSFYPKGFVLDFVLSCSLSLSQEPPAPLHLAGSHLPLPGHIICCVMAAGQGATLCSSC